MQVVPALLGVMVCAHGVSAQKLALRWKYVPGNEVVYRVTSHQDMLIPAMGGTSSSEQIQTMRWRVTGVAPNGDATVAVMIERVQANTRGLPGKLHYNSETGVVPDQPQARIFAAMAGSSYSMVIGADGVVRSVEGMEAVRQRMLEAMPEQAALLNSLSGELFSDEATVRLMQQSIQMLPSEPVATGDTWDNSFSLSVPMLGTMTTSMTFTLSGIEQRDGRNVALISAAGEMVLGSDSTSQVGVSVDLNGTKLDGTIEFDADRGLTVASSTTMVMQMTVGAGGQDMTMNMTQTSKLELVEYVPGG